METYGILGDVYKCTTGYAAFVTAACPSTSFAACSASRTITRILIPSHPSNS